MVIVTTSTSWGGELQRSLAQGGMDVALLSNPLLALDFINGQPAHVVWVVDLAAYAIERATIAEEARKNTYVLAVASERPALEQALAMIGRVDYFLLFPAQNLDQVVRVCARHEVQFSAAGFVVDARYNEAKFQGVTLELTNVEFRILAALVRNHGRKQMSYVELAADVHGENLEAQAAVKRLKTQVHNLRQKIKAIAGFDPISSKRGAVFWVTPRGNHSAAG